LRFKPFPHPKQQQNATTLSYGKPKNVTKIQSQGTESDGNLINIMPIDIKR
jgi:hypothetical protein